MSAILPATVLFSLSVGRYPIAVGDILQYLLSGKYTDENVPVLITQVRMPRIVMAILAGGALSVSGAAYQGVFRNPIVSPDILGVSSGAGFGAALAILFFPGLAGLQISAFVLGLLSVSLSLIISKSMAAYHDRTLMLVLSGMIVGSLFSALISLMKYIADGESKLPEITFWLMGNLSAASMVEIRYILPVVIIALIPILLTSWKLNILSFGDEEARAMGLNPDRLRFTVICCASLLTASIVSVTGLIGWVGLIIPHFARFVVGPNHKQLFPASFLIGSSFMLCVDDIARSAFPLEIPLGIITSVIGAPLFFIIIRMSSKKIW